MEKRNKNSMKIKTQIAPQRQCGVGAVHAPRLKWTHRRVACACFDVMGGLHSKILYVKVCKKKTSCSLSCLGEADEDKDTSRVLGKGEKSQINKREQAIPLQNVILP